MPKKLNIGFVLDDTLDTPDGVQQYVLTVGEWLKQQGHTVHYIVGHTTRQDIDNVHSMARNVRVKFNQNKLSIPLPANKKLLHKKLLELQLDVLHVQMPYSPLFAGRVIKAVPPTTKVIGTFHIVPATWLERSGARTLQIITRSTLRRFNAIASVSPAAQSFAKTVFGINSVVIPNAVSLSTFRRRPIYLDTIQIVFLGRLVERKGCIWLLRALKIVQDATDIPYAVTIAGKGELRQKMEAFVKDNAIRNVTFVGFVEESSKPDLLAKADITTFPSTAGESFGIVLIEAMAAGSRVVIGGNNVGYSSVLSDKPELLVDPKNSQAFAETLLHFITNKAVRKETLAWNKKTVEQYDINIVGNNLLDLYNK